MTKKLSAEERADIEKEARAFDDTLGEIQQFDRLRRTFPDLSDAEIAHRMVAPIKQVKRLKKLLGD